MKTDLKAHNASGYKSLGPLKFGDGFKVLNFQGELALQERLSEVGIRKGMTLVYFSKAPFSGPLIFRVGATMFALREEELSCLILEKI